MEKSNIYIERSNSRLFLFMLVLFSLMFILLPSCSKEDDIPPPSAYVPPEPDTTGACVFLTVMPELSGEEAVEFECEGPEFSFFGEKDGTITIEYVDNPAPGGINSSEQVVQVTQSSGIEPWAGFFFDLAAPIDFTSFQDIKIKVYSPAADQMVNLKLEDSADPALSTEISASTTVANEWEELCFSFSSDDSGKFDRFVLFFDFLGPKDQETIHYFDDIILGEGCMVITNPTTEPTMAAPTPTIDESEVISVFSDAYTNVADTDFNPDWGQATEVSQVDINGDNTLRYENLNYQGIVLGSSIDVAEMAFLHVDFWTSNSTSINASLISPGPVEIPYAFTISTEQWVSVDIPLSEYSGIVDLMEVFQMKFDGNGTIFLDNIYFHMGQPQVMEPSVAAPEPTVPEGNVISVFSDSYMDVSGTDFNPNWGQATEVSQVDINGNNTLKYENLNYQGTMFSSALDVSDMNTVHVDYWTANSTAINYSLISSGPSETPYAFEIFTAQWVSLDIPLTEFSSVVDLMDVIQLKFDGDGTIYLDNIYFYKAQATEPSMAAPAPSVPEADVISVFSDAYTNVADTDFNPNWGQATLVSQVDIAGNNTLKYENLNYQGTMFSSALDISDMNTVHVDYWTANSTAINYSLISTGPAETPYAFEIVTGEWVSLDIPLSEYSSIVDLMDVIQMKFDGDGTIYLDNIYFYK